MTLMLAMNGRLCRSARTTTCLMSPDGKSGLASSWLPCVNTSASTEAFTPENTDAFSPEYTLRSSTILTYNGPVEACLVCAVRPHIEESHGTHKACLYGTKAEKEQQTMQTAYINSYATA